MMSITQSTADEDEKTKQLNQVLTSITKITIEAIKYSISAIKTPSALVSEPEFIVEFLSNCDRLLFNKIRDHVVNLRSSNDLKPLSVTCTHCSHEYKQDFSLDSSNFFEQAS